jgi:uncharacterized protein YjbJ (UPF0337 family)
MRGQASNGPFVPKERRSPRLVVRTAKAKFLTASKDTGGVFMDWNRVEGNWKQFKGQIKEKWGNLTDDDLDRIEGNRDQLEGRIQERYGIAKDQVRKDVDTWLNSV